MINTTKNKSLIAIIIFLILTNIAMLIFFLYLKPGKRMHSKEDSIASFLRKELSFNDKQLTNYNLLKDKHFQNIKPAFEDIRNAKDSLYNLLYQSNISDSLVKMKALIIGTKQTDLDVQMFNHFKNIRALCEPEQLPKFDSSFKKVVQRFTHGRFAGKKNK